MSVEEQSDQIIVVSLRRQLREHDELQGALDIVHGRGNHNVVVDFSDVDVTGCTTLARLLELRQVLQDSGRRLLLCGVAPATRGIFAVARLDGVFDFVKDQSAALARLQLMGASP